MKILIVEDSRDSSQMLELLLAPYGECSLATDGVAALELIDASWKIDDPYDVIILDIMMPKMDGLEMLARLRQAEEERGFGGILGAKVVMLSALEDEETITQAITLGCEGYVCKTAGAKRIISKLKEMGLISAETV